MCSDETGYGVGMVVHATGAVFGTVGDGTGIRGAGGVSVVSRVW